MWSKRWSSFVNTLKELLRDLWYFRSTIIIFITPVILLFLPLGIGTKESNCLYVVFIMAIYWMTEVVPLPVTALMPIFMFPALGVLPSKEVAVNYMQDANFLFVGGLIIAVAVEQSNLHLRVALRVLIIVGSKPKWSMWMSNTATTAMMFPIVLAVCVELIKQQRRTAAAQNDTVTAQDFSENDAVEAQGETVPLCQQIIRDDLAVEDILTPHNLTSDELNLCRALLLSIAYAANIGGTATLTGTPPNIVMEGILETIYGDKTGVTFASWMAFSLPGAIINVVLAWTLLVCLFLGWKTLLGLSKEEEDEKVRNIIVDRYKQLGKMNFAEISVLCLFLCLVVLWLLRDPKFITGWGSLFKSGYMSDGSAAIFISFFLFFLPFERPDWLCVRDRVRQRPPIIRKPLLEWDVMQRKFPWGIVILLGGGFALGGAVKESGLSNLIGVQLQSLHFLSPFALCAVAIVMMTFLTEVTSNTATASIFIPILTSVAERVHVNPLYFVLAITVCSSYAFMLPVATPPNAIVFGAGLLRVIDMMMAGFAMNCICIIVMILSINTWTYTLFDLGTYPSWAPAPNITAIYNITRI